ncbi:MAG TPA: S26 family signal peptidase, partial [Gemmataceae bacterium]|nr:S26 family signal peptidase [Gemmataceae bacterium]
MDGIPPSFRSLSSFRRPLTGLVLTVCFLLLLQAFVLEPFQVPTGSMAPTLLGHHRSAVCPRCGYLVDVGRTHADHDGSGGERCYSQASCPNCGSRELPLGRSLETRGDHLLVNKSLYAMRAPRRWEIVVFRMFGKVFIKRLIGLGGEEVELVDGDIYVDGKLARKTFDEFLGMRVLVFDNDFAPEPDGWKDRWEFQPEKLDSLSSKEPLTLDGRAHRQQLTYRHFSLDEGKCLPIADEYGYNGDKTTPAEPVHDFMLDAEMDVVEGRGSVVFSLTDGEVEAEAEIAIGETRDAFVRTSPGESAVGPKMQLEAGKRYHIEMALVDRRLTMRVDGRDAFAPLDFPEARNRAPVVQPLHFTAHGVLIRLHKVRLYRDLHYTQLGK